MKRYSLTHLSDESLRRELAGAAANEKQATAELLARIAEFDERKLYLPAAYPSMLAYCKGALHLSEDAAKKRIQVARAGRQYPEVFDALADGRVHLTGLGILAPRLEPDTVDELLAAATHKSKGEIERLVAERFPRSAVLATVRPIGPAGPAFGEDEGAPVHPPGLEMTAPSAAEGAPAHLQPHSRVSPLSAEAFAVQFTRSREADERFRYLQDLLGHKVSSGDLAEVYDRAVRELITRMERVRFGACTKPRTGRHRASSDSRYVPAHLKRAVWQRDGGQCTFVSDSGRRCEARGDVEFDHVMEIARGGETTIEGLRLRCRGHNQFTAERTFGAGFMRQKREAAAAAHATKDRADGNTDAGEAAEGLPPDGSNHDVYRALRALGYRAGESRRAVALCADMRGVSPEDKLRRALTYFPQRCHRVERFAEASRVSAPAPGRHGGWTQLPRYVE